MTHSLVGRCARIGMFDAAASTSSGAVGSRVQRPRETRRSFHVIPDRSEIGAAEDPTG